MPDPKSKGKTLSERIAEASQQVLGPESAPSQEEMTDEELLVAFGGEKKKEPSPQKPITQDPGLLPQKPTEELPSSYQESVKILKPQEEKPGSGSKPQSSEPVDNGVGPVLSTLNKLGQTIAQAPNKLLLEPAAIIGDALEKVLPIGDAPSSLEESWMIKLAEKKYMESLG